MYIQLDKPIKRYHGWKSVIKELLSVKKTGERKAFSNNEYFYDTLIGSVQAIEYFSYMYKERVFPNSDFNKLIARVKEVEDITGFIREDSPSKDGRRDFITFKQQPNNGSKYSLRTQSNYYDE